MFDAFDVRDPGDIADVFRCEDITVGGKIPEIFFATATGNGVHCPCGVNASEGITAFMEIEAFIPLPLSVKHPARLAYFLLFALLKISPKVPMVLGALGMKLL